LMMASKIKQSLGQGLNPKVIFIFFTTKALKTLCATKIKLL